jgi:hypothetical protein
MKTEPRRRIILKKTEVKRVVRTGFKLLVIIEYVIKWDFPIKKNSNGDLLI